VLVVKGDWHCQHFVKLGLGKSNFDLYIRWNPT